MKVVIFLGPTLALSEARRILDAIYLPPVRQADLLSAVLEHEPDVVALIDGEFQQAPSVWHKEILWSLAHGVVVYGASSMGALRAAETRQFGMIGIGEIFSRYASGDLSDDDEVAVGYTSDNGQEYRLLSEPLINIRVTLEIAQSRDLITTPQAAEALETAQSLYFPERSFQSLYRALQARGWDNIQLQLLQHAVSECYRDVKREDAILLLETLAQLNTPPTTANVHTADFDSYLFRSLYNRDRRVLRAGQSVSMNSIARYAALQMPRFNEFHERAVSRALLLVLADILHVEPTKEDINRETTILGERLGIRGKDDLQAWAMHNDLRPGELKDLLREQAIFRRMRLWFLRRKFVDGSVKFVLDLLRLEGEYPAWADAAAAGQRVIKAWHLSSASETIATRSIAELAEAHEHEAGLRLGRPLEVWAEEAGFQDLQELRAELLHAARIRSAYETIVDALVPDTMRESPDADDG